jgi:nitrite reductase (NADH) small subunit
MAFVRVAVAGALAPSEACVVMAGGREYALFNLDGEYFCMDNECPHAGGPLGEGTVDRDAVMCPWHCWCFDIRTGEGLYGLGIGVGTYPCRVEGGEIQIEI